jgi:GDPmannose 4,6-dehydratase
MKAIIFGANGQDGHYLKALLEEEGMEVTGVSRRGDFLRVSLTDREAVAALIKEQQPAYIFHLAADSTTKHTALWDNHDTIATGTLAILEAVKDHSPHSRVLISGSGLQFENHDRPIKETDAFEVRDAYSVSRIQSVYAARYYRSLGLKVYVSYFFNHDSPLRSERHVSKKIAMAAKRIGAGSMERLQIGDISVKKEWAFAGDIVKGILTLVQQDKIFEAIIGSGTGYTIEEWLEVCFGIAGKNWKDHTDQQAGFKAEYRQLVSDPALIHSLGWKAETSFEALAAMMMAGDGQTS